MSQFLKNLYYKFNNIIFSKVKAKTRRLKKLEKLVSRNFGK